MCMKEKWVPGGILEPVSVKSFLFFGTHYKSSDFIADGLLLWWQHRRFNLQGLKQLVSPFGLMAPGIFAVMAPLWGSEMEGSNGSKNARFFLLLQLCWLIFPCRVLAHDSFRHRE